VPFGVVKIELLRLDRPVERGGTAMRRTEAPPRAIEIGDRLESVGAGLLGLMIERQRRAGQVIEQRFQGLIIERQPVLHAGIAAAGADRFVERVVAAARSELLAIARSEAMDRCVVEQYLADRSQVQFVNRARRALRQRIKAAQALDRVAEEIEADRLRRSGRVEIDDAAAVARIMLESH